MYTVILMAALSGGSASPAIEFPCGSPYPGAGPAISFPCRPPYPAPPPCYGHGCYGYYPGWYCFGTWDKSPYRCAGCLGSLVGPAAPWQAAPLPLVPAPIAPTPGPKSPAKVKVELPADAKLYVDGVLMKTGSAVRVLETPALAPGRTYVYELRAEIVRAGREFSVSQTLVIHPGEPAEASFRDLEQRAAAAVPRLPPIRPAAEH